MSTTPETLKNLAASLDWSNIPDQRAQILAEAFHATYERLAPGFGYETRTETKKFDAFSANGRLMIAVCGEILSALASKPAPAEPLHLGACITGGKLHATAMRYEADRTITVVATAELDVDMLTKSDCHAIMAATPAEPAQAHGVPRVDPSQWQVLAEMQERQLKALEETVSSLLVIGEAPADQAQQAVSDEQIAAMAELIDNEPAFVAGFEHGYRAAQPAAPVVPKAVIEASLAEDLMTKIQAFGLACCMREPGEDQIAMQDEIRATLAEALAAAPVPPKWLPIESAPKGGRVLLFTTKTTPHIGIHDWEHYDVYNSPGFTHWMPLPPPPADHLAKEPT